MELRLLGWILLVAAAVVDALAAPIPVPGGSSMGIMSGVGWKSVTVVRDKNNHTATVVDVVDEQPNRLTESAAHSYVPISVHNGFRRLSSRLMRNTHRIFSGTYSLIPTLLENRRLRLLRKHSGDRAISFSQYKFVENSNDDLWKIATMAGQRYFLGSRMSNYYHFLKPMLSSNPWAWSGYPSSYNNVSFDHEVRDRVLVNRRRNYLLSTLVQTNRNFLDNNVAAIEDSILAAQSNSSCPTYWSVERNYNVSQVAEAVHVSKRNIRKSLSMLTALFETRSHKSQNLHINTNVIPHHVLRDFSRCVSGEGLAPYIPIIRWGNFRNIANHIYKVSC
jgi:hypothetical protein